MKSWECEAIVISDIPSLDLVRIIRLAAGLLLVAVKAN